MGKAKRLQRQAKGGGQHTVSVADGLDGEQFYEKPAMDVDDSKVVSTGAVQARPARLTARQKKKLLKVRGKLAVAPLH